MILGRLPCASVGIAFMAMGRRQILHRGRCPSPLGKVMTSVSAPGAGRCSASCLIREREAELVVSPDTGANFNLLVSFICSPLGLTKPGELYFLAPVFDWGSLLYICSQYKKHVASFLPRRRGCCSTALTTGICYLSSFGFWLILCLHKKASFSPAKTP